MLKTNRKKCLVAFFVVLLLSILVIGEALAADHTIYDNEIAYIVKLSTTYGTDATFKNVSLTKKSGDTVLDTTGTNIFYFNTDDSSYTGWAISLSPSAVGTGTYQLKYDVTYKNNKGKKTTDTGVTQSFSVQVLSGIGHTSTVQFRIVNGKWNTKVNGIDVNNVSEDGTVLTFQTYICPKNYKSPKECNLDEMYVFTCSRTHDTDVNHVNCVSLEKLLLAILGDSKATEKPEDYIIKNDGYYVDFAYQDWTIDSGNALDSKYKPVFKNNVITGRSQMQAVKDNIHYYDENGHKHASSSASDNDNHGFAANTVYTLTLLTKPYDDKKKTEYTVMYLESGTTHEVHDPVTVTGVQSEQSYTEEALEIPGYKLDGDKYQTKEMVLDKTKNVFIFYYKPLKSELAISKKSTLPAGKTYLEVGDKINYTVTVENTGDTTISDIEVQDQMGRDGAKVTWSNGTSLTITSLEPGATKEFYGYYVVTDADVAAGSVLNEATFKNPGTDPKGGTPDVDDDIDDDGELDNSTLDITVTKEWDDNNDQDGKRAGYIVTLYADSASKQDVSLAADKLTYTFNDLPAYKYVDKTKTKINYTVNESVVPNGYTATVSGYKVKNSYTPETTTYTFSKVWVDGNNADGLRNSYKVTIFKNGEAHNTVTLGKDDTSYTWTDLPKYYDKGKTVVWSVDETTVPEGYTYKVEGNTITNTHEFATTTFSFSKVWDDGDNADGLRGDYAVTLYQDGKTYNTASLTKDDDSYTWTDLPLSNNGTKIIWTVAETTIPDGYTPTVDGGKITNTHEFATTTFSFSKIWDDGDNADGLRGDYEVTLYNDGKTYNTAKLTKDNDSYTWSDLPVKDNGTEIKWTVAETKVPEGYTPTVDGSKITNTHEFATTTFSFSKVWDDGDNADGLRDDYAVTLYQDGKTYNTANLTKDEDSYTWTDLPLSDNGIEIKWTVDETSIPYGYIATVDGSKITNTHDPDSANYTVYKVWDDNDNSEGMRSDYTVTLYRDGASYDTVTLSPDVLSYTWYNLFTQEDGKSIVWSVEETKVPEGYTVETDNSNKGFSTLTNTLGGKLTVTKTVAGNSVNKEKEFTFTVALSSDTYDGTYGDVTFTEGKATFTLKDSEKKVIAYLPEGIGYTVTEEDYTAEGYVTTMLPGPTGTFTNNGNAEVSVYNTRQLPGSLTVTNEVEPGAGDPEKEFEFIVTLDDPTVNGDHGSMTFVDGVAVIKLKGGESITATDLPDGVHYTVVEKDYSSEGYYVSSTGDTGTIDYAKPAVATFFNTTTPPGIHFVFTKKWSGGHLDHIDWKLYKPDGSPAQAKFEKVTVSENEWRYEAWLIDKLDYYLIEEVPTGYSVLYQNVDKHAGVSDRCYNGGTIINTKLPPTGDTVPLPLLIGLLVLSLSGVTLTLTLNRKRRKQ